MGSEDSGSVTTGGGRTYGGESAATRASRRRAQLLAAGREVIGSAGYRGATVRRLCRAARVADRTFYEEFAGTEELLLAVYHDCLDELEREVLAGVAAAGEDPEHLARAGLDAFFACLERDRCLARVVWFEVLGVSARVDAAYMERTARFGELLLALVDERGLAPVEDGGRGVLVQAVVGGVSQVVLTWVYADLAAPREQLVDPLVRFLLRNATSA